MSLLERNPVGEAKPAAGRHEARDARLATRLAESAADVARARQLRYQVFYEEGGAIAPAGGGISRIERCPFDGLCDHLLVVAGEGPGGEERVVATCRLLSGEVAAANGGFCSAGEFDLSALLARHRPERLVEISRVCVAADHRRGRVIEMLWRGVWAHIAGRGVEALIGCASFPGRSVAAHAAGLACLRARAPLEPDIDVPPLAGRAIAPPNAEAAHPSRLPPLIRAYLRLGARFGVRPVVDRQFGTVDVFTCLPLAAVRARYRQFRPAREPDAGER